MPTISSFYHGDFDAKGVEILALLRRRFGVRPWLYGEASCREAVARHRARTRALQVKPGDALGDDDLANAMGKLGRDQLDERD